MRNRALLYPKGIITQTTLPTGQCHCYSCDYFNNPQERLPVPRGHWKLDLGLVSECIMCQN